MLYYNYITIFYFSAESSCIDLQHICFSLSQALNKIALIKAIINWVVNFITDYVAPWIIERGGWVSFICINYFHICEDILHWFKLRNEN